MKTSGALLLAALVFLLTGAADPPQKPPPNAAAAARAATDDLLRQLADAQKWAGEQEHEGREQERAASFHEPAPLMRHPARPSSLRA